VALSARRLAEWMASDRLDLLVIQIDGLHIGDDLVLVSMLGIDADGYKHPLALVEGACIGKKTSERSSWIPSIKLHHMGLSTTGLGRKPLSGC
jgi:hypothetical protein